MRKKIALLTLTLAVLVCTVVYVKTAELPKITLDDIRQISAEDQNAISTAHIIYTHEQIIHQPFDSKITDIIGFELSEANRYILTEEELFLDKEAKRAKQVITDLRDVNALIADFNVPDTRLNRLNLDRSRIVLSRQDGIFRLNPKVPAASFDSPSTGTYEPDFSSLGVIAKEIIKQEAHLSNIAGDGGTLLQIEQSREVPAGFVNTTIVCDPAIGYRFRSIRWDMEGGVFGEIIADDYRDVNGIPYPFSYISRTLDPRTGNVEREDKYAIKQAEFGIELPEEDLKVFVPKDTLIMSTIPESPGRSIAVHSKVHTDKEMGMDEIKALCDEAKELYKEQHPESQP
jgi:hypothetical protein